MPHLQEILDNYSAILTYELPSHFFMQDDLLLAYVGQNHPNNSWRFGEGVFHLIQLRSLSDGVRSRLILVNDENGEITEHG